MNKAEEKLNKRLEELNGLMKKKIDSLGKWQSELKDSIDTYDPLTTDRLLLLIIREARSIKEIQEEIAYIYATL